MSLVFAYADEFEPVDREEWEAGRPWPPRNWPPVPDVRSNTEEVVAVELPPSTCPRVRRKGRWTYFNHPFNGPVWRLDGTELDLEHDRDSHAVCAGGDRCNGAWVLYEHGRYREPVAEYLDDAMNDVEQRWDALNAVVAFLFAVCGLVARRWNRTAGTKPRR